MRAKGLMFVAALVLSFGVGLAVRAARGGSPLGSVQCSLGEFKSYTQLQIAEEQFWRGLREAHRIPANCSIVLDGEEWVWGPMPQAEIMMLRHPPAGTAPVTSGN